MIQTVPRKLVTRDEWAEARGYNPQTVKGWCKNPKYAPYPPVVEWRGGGPTPFYWDTDWDRWKKAHPTLGLGRGGHKRKAGE